MVATRSRRLAILLTVGTLSASSFNCWVPAYAAKKVARTADQFKLRSGLTKVGPLHMSDGVVLIQDRDVVVMSDASDPLAEAELSGVVINSTQADTASGPTVQGQVFFEKGMSLPALDDGSQLERVTLKDGSSVEGRIMFANSAVVSIKIKRSGSRTYGTENVVAIRSPRAFNFQLAKDPDPAANGANLTSFIPTWAGPSSSHIADETTQMKLRLPKHSALTKTVMAAAAVAAIGACFVIPAVVAVKVQPPRNSNNNSGGGGGGSSGGSSSGGSSSSSSSSSSSGN